MSGAIGRISFSILAASLLWACASVVPPSGGDKDEQPPQVVKSNPAMGQLNVNPRTIEVDFDERIAENNLKQELLISPSPGNDWSHTVKNRKLILQFPNGFPANKTISFKFREGIQDVTESNRPKDLSLVFSTGKTLDSLMVSGKVISYPDLKPIQGATVGLFSISDTLNLKKNKPNYFTITDKTGGFDIAFLPDSPFKIMAWSDANKNLTYEDRNEHLGFVTDTIIPGKTTDIELKFGFQDSDTIKLLEKGEDSLYSKLYFNKGLEKLSLETFPGGKKLKAAKEKDFYKVFAPKSIFQKDSIRIKVEASDSSDNKFSDTLWLKTQVKADTIELKKKLWEGSTKKRYNIVNGEPLLIKTFEAVEMHSTLKWVVTGDSGRGKDYEGITPVLTQKGVKVSLPKSNKTIRVISPPNWLSNGFGKSTGRDTLYIDQTTSEEGGIIHMAVEKLKYPWIVQLLSEDMKVIDEIANETKFDFINIRPGNYKLRLVEDLNGNGRWDWGHLERKQQPEPVRIKPNTILIKANFEIDTITF